VQEVEVHLSILKELQKFLFQFVEDIKGKSEEFNRRVMQLLETGLSIQIEENYETNYGIQTLHYLHNLIANITDNDLLYINAEIVRFEQILNNNNMVYQGYSNTPIYRIEGNMIYQGYSNTPVYRIDGNMIYKGYSNEPVYRIEGNMIYEKYSGIPIYRIERNMIYQGYSGKPVDRIE